jgi:hypothetical protein
MSAILEWVSSLLALILAKFKSKPDTSPVPEPATTVEPVTVTQSDDHPPTAPVTIDVTVDEAKKEEPFTSPSLASAATTMTTSTKGLDVNGMPELSDFSSQAED